MKLNDKTRSILCVRYKNKGFTLPELMVAILVVGILAALALPAVDGYLEKRRIIAAAEEIYSQLQFARSEAFKQSTQTYVNFSLTGTPTGSIWDSGVSTSSGCDPVPGGAANCLISGAEKAVHSTAFPGVSINSVTFGGDEADFEPIRGLADNGSVILQSSKYEIRVRVSNLGRIRICSPSGGTPDTYVSGYPDDANCTL